MEEPGELENRISMDVNDSRWSETLNAWEDGNEYVLKEVRVRQVSPGEFEIVDVVLDKSSREMPEKAGDAAPRTPSATSSLAPRGRPNPAVLALLGQNR